MDRPVIALLTCGAAAVSALTGCAGAEAGAGLPDALAASVEYRPGGYMPPGFPLEGSVRLLSSPVVRAGERQRVRVEYTVGGAGVRAGESLEVWKHFTSDVEEFQVDNPEAPAYFGLEASAPGAAWTKIAHSNALQRNNPSVFPYRKALGARLESGTIPPGTKVHLDLGGARGVRMQHYAENLFNFRIVIAGENGLPRDYGGDAFLKVTGGRASKLRVVAPAYASLGERFAVEVIPSDEWGSLAENYQDWELDFEASPVSPSPFEYDPELQHYVASGVVANQAGTHRVRVRSRDGTLQGTSNPIRVEEHLGRRLYYGDLHQHTYLHDGRGVSVELYLHARRNGLLDFGSLTPHHMPLGVTGPSYHFDKFQDPRDNWPRLLRANRLMNGWKGLVTIPGYEYSVGTRLGGHHNVIYNDDGPPTTMQLDRSKNLADVGVMMDVLKRARVPSMVIPHIGGGPPDWEHRTDPRIERSFEIASVHGVFEESWQSHLNAGLRLGATASGDNHTVGFGNSYPGLIYTMTNPLTGVFAFERTRDSIWEGLYQRRTIGVTGNQRISMDFSLNGEPMGGEVAAAAAVTARLRARVSGTAPLTRVELIRNGKVIHARHPSRHAGSVVRVTWGDNIYQRRANVGMAKGGLSVQSGSLRLLRFLNRDQQFEQMHQNGSAVRWHSAATSNDRDGMLVRLDGADGSLEFKLEDPHLGRIAFSLPLAELRRDGYARLSTRGERPFSHPYLEKMGIESRFEAEFELVREDGPMDIELDYEDREPPKPGDYFYLRMEQLDANEGWASPVWIN